MRKLTPKICRDLIADEIRDSKKYARLGLNEIARDEMRHAMMIRNKCSKKKIKVYITGP